MPIRPENRARYPMDWALRSRFVRFVRARGRCERVHVGPRIVGCGAIHGEPHPVTGSTVVLTTAHVFDARPEAAHLLNLAAWCQKCHNGFDAQERLRGRMARAGRVSPQPSIVRRGASLLRRLRRPSAAERRADALARRVP